MLGRLNERSHGELDFGMQNFLETHFTILFSNVED